MQLAHLLLLLVLLVANANPVTSIEDQPAIYQTTSQRSLSDKVDVKRLELKDDDPSGVPNSESEERGLITSAASRFTSIFGKNPGLSSKLGSTQQNSEMVAAIAKMPIVKKLETTMQKNPSFLKQLSNNPESLKKLAKDPQVVQVSAMMKKKGFRFTKDNVNQLRSAAGKDPAKRGVLEAIKGLSKNRQLALFDTVILLIILASGAVVGSIVLTRRD